MAVSHGDVIKAILADALGMHLDSFQRIVVDPASVSIVRYTDTRPYVVTANSTTADLAPLVAAAQEGTSPPDEDLRRRSRGRRTRRREAPTERQAAPGQVLGSCSRMAMPATKCSQRIAPLTRLYAWRFSCTATTRRTGSWPAPSASRASGHSSCRRGRGTASPPSPARSSRSRCWPSTWTRSSTRCCGGVRAGLSVPPAAAKAQRHRSVGRADHRGVPGRHHDHRLGSEIDRIVIELFSNVDVEDDEPADGDTSRSRPEEPEEIDADEVFVVKITASYARDFVARAQALVAAGRPPCPFCLQPIDPHGHICPRANGYRRPLFD